MLTWTVESGFPRREENHQLTPQRERLKTNVCSHFLFFLLALNAIKPTTKRRKRCLHRLTFNPRSYLRTLLASPAALALAMAVLYMSMRSNRRDSSPVAPAGAAGGAVCEAAVTLGAGGVTAGAVSAGVSSSSSSRTSFSSA